MGKTLSCFCSDTDIYIPQNSLTFRPKINRILTETELDNIHLKWFSTPVETEHASANGGITE
jgi:hypothetical protein